MYNLYGCYVYVCIIVLVICIFISICISTIALSFMCVIVFICVFMPVAFSAQVKCLRARCLRARWTAIAETNDGLQFLWDACTEQKVERKLLMKKNELAATATAVAKRILLSEPATAVAEHSSELKAEARNVTKIVARAFRS